MTSDAKTKIMTSNSTNFQTFGYVGNSLCFESMLIHKSLITQSFPQFYSLSSNLFLPSLIYKLPCCPSVPE